LHLASEYERLVPVLLEQGYHAVDAVPAMLLDPIDALPAYAPELVVQRADRLESLSHFATTAFESFGYPVELAPIAFTQDLVRLPHCELFVGYLAGEPACCSLLLITGDIAGIYWVGVRAAQRRRGLGAAITAHAALAARARGCTIASLQASTMGAPVYRRMGFTTLRHYLRFDLPLA
jgi:GNAT superfamily N-acetyltransferase